ncbi:MAG: hypothetical protein Q9168_004478 [Polycauliona sp. 1 TL-2023]
MLISLPKSLWYLYIISLSVAAAIPTPFSSAHRDHALLDVRAPQPTTYDRKYWTFKSAYSGVPLQADAVMMLCVQAMAESARLIPDKPFYHWAPSSHPEYPGVVMRMSIYLKSPDYDESITTGRWASWIIEDAIRELMTHETYRAAQFRGMWKGETVVQIEIAPTRLGDQQQTIGIPGVSAQQITQPAGTQNPASDQTIVTFPSNTSMSARPATDQHRMVIQYLATPIDKRDIFMMIISIMVDLAPGGEEGLNTFGSKTGAVSAPRLEISDSWQGYNVPQVPVRFSSDDLSNLLYVLPIILLKEDKWFEMDIVATDQKVLVAKGGVRLANGTATAS